MSHDRGCFRCGAEQWEYQYCKAEDCPKAEKHTWEEPRTVSVREEAPEDFKAIHIPTPFAIGKPFSYKYSEDASIKELENHIDNTYGAHYVGDEKIQCWDAWEALGNCETSHRDTALKYLWRYGKKNGFNRGDLLKALHYIIILLHYNTKFHSKQKGE